MLHSHNRAALTERRGPRFFRGTWAGCCGWIRHWMGKPQAVGLGMARVLIALGWAACLGAYAKDIPPFVAPAARTVQAFDQPWQGGLLTLAYHEVEDYEPSQAYLSVRTDHLVEQLAWLYHNGYQAVSVDQILAANAGQAALPERAVLLSFDDGYQSFYSRIFPILKAYGWPFVIAPVGQWLDTPENQSVDFGGAMTARERFLTWHQVREMVRSPLVEVGAHTNALHYGIVANPQGNLQPAAATYQYLPHLQRYENDQEYSLRLSEDIAAISGKIEAVTGRKPRVWVWPYGAAQGTALKLIGENGYAMALTLEDGLGTVDALMSTPRMLVANDPSTAHFANAIRSVETHSMMRVVHVDLDYVYDPDPVQMDRNLGLLVQRISDLGVNTVFLQAYADPDGDGLVRSLYFPNRWLPMRADLFNRAAWQLSSRASVQVYAWMPVLSFDLDATLPRVLQVPHTQSDTPEAAHAQQDAQQYARLSPFDARARQQIGDLYEDLAKHSAFQGILFHDDAVLSDFEDASEAALAAYRAAGLPDSIAQLRGDEATFERWTRFKSQYLVDFTLELAQRVRAVRGPQVKTARNIFAQPILMPISEQWFAQNLDDFLRAYDWTAPMAMPLMEGVELAHADAWLDALVDAVAQRPGALDRVVFELQARDWRQDTQPYLDAQILAQWMNRLQLRGARNYGYYPDNFLLNEPALATIRPALSSAWYPYHD